MDSSFMGILPFMHPNVLIVVNQAEVSTITVIGNSSVPSSCPALSDLYSAYGTSDVSIRNALAVHSQNP